ncbi:hypothetical protein Prudu_016896, partial [Prunus dulcis]
SCDREQSTVRSGPNLQEECPIPCGTYRNFQIGIWRSWAPWTRLTQFAFLESIGDVWGTWDDVEVPRGVGYRACGQTPYMALVVPVYGEIL